MIWVYDFVVCYFGDKIVEMDKVKLKFQEVFFNVWKGFVENDSFNCLVLVVGLNWWEVVMLWVYVKYFK